MPKIKILDNFTVNQIAAGEVIERPASVVKELVENSIDAKSSAITIEVKDGGISFIRVTDNGEGMDNEDARLAFCRHATSKISSAPDLTRISSLGFRGEALASIASVAQVEMITRQQGGTSGTKIINHGGKILSVSEIGCPEGTTLMVRNLFYNTPARLKFLKSPKTETANISNLVGKFILAHPEISFKYINQGRIIYHSPGNGNLLSSIICVYGSKVKDEVLEIKKKDEIRQISLYGYLGKPSLARRNRNHESFFVNGRYIKSNLLSQCVEEAYKPYLTVNRFPWMVLNICVPADMVDVNVHPAKTEIRFKNEREIYNLLVEWIRETLKSNPYIPKIRYENLETAAVRLKEEDRSTGEQQNIFSSLRVGEDFSLREKKHAEDVSGFNKKEKLAKNSINKDFCDNNIKDFKSVPLKIVGRAFSTYIILEGEKQLFFVDQHAAHERLIYETLKEMWQRQQVTTQQLLPPLILEVTHREKIVLNESRDVFLRLGFELEPFGSNSFAIRGVPAVLAGANIREFFRDLLDEAGVISRSPDFVLDEENVIKMACKKAVKAHDNLSDKEIIALVECLASENVPMTCPHGRPIMITLTQHELEKKFKRVQ